MKFMHRFTALFLAMLMVVSLVACGSKEEDTPVDEGNKEPEKELITSIDYSVVDNGTLMYGDPAYATDFRGTGATGANGGASCASDVVSQIAVDLMAKGGNAIDAAVALIFGAGLCEPGSSGIGGAGQMVIYLAAEKKYVVVEYMTQAGENAISGQIITERDSYPGDPIDPCSIAIPGTVAGCLTALEMYGNLTAAEVLEPIIKLAREGWEVTDRFNACVEGSFVALSNYEYALNLFTDGGFMYNEGDIITNNDLADTYQLIADEGMDGFYRSDFTQQLVDYIQSQGGCLTMADFAQYEAKIREPIQTTYRGYTITTVGGPSNGGSALLEMLNIIENFDLPSWGHDDARTVQVINDAYSLGYQDGLKYCADPDYYNLPTAEMISKEYAKERATNITVGTMLKGAKPGKLTVTESETMAKVEATYTVDQGGTTHMVAADQYGNWVSTTNTLGLTFGSGLAVPGTGFTWSAHLNNLTNSKGAIINKMVPYARVRSTMCPAIVADENGVPVMATGSPGNWALVSATLNSIINYIDFDMDVAEAVTAARSWRDGISFDLAIEGARDCADSGRHTYSDETLIGLLNAGFSVKVDGSTYGSSVGNNAAIAKGEDGNYYVIGDPRRHYGAAAY